MKNKILWVVDCQNDFINANGKLYVQHAEKIKPNLKKIVEFARKNGMKIIYTRDWHDTTHAEISDAPNFITTFPPHCMMNTEGAEIIAEINPSEAFEIPIEEIDYAELKKIVEENNEIILNKNVFDVFAGNKNMQHLIPLLNIGTIYIAGVATNVCVDAAVVGFASQTKAEVKVFTDAIKELPNLPVETIIDKWVNSNVRLISTASIRG